jgi:GDP-4-dehydro-6-deoxy-D-mannose reductase
MIEYSEMDIEIRRDPNRERKIDLPLLMGSPEKIMKATGWRPMIAIEDTIADIYHEMSIRIENEMISDCSD